MDDISNAFYMHLVWHRLCTTPSFYVLGLNFCLINLAILRHLKKLLNSNPHTTSLSPCHLSFLAPSGF